MDLFWKEEYPNLFHKLLTYGGLFYWGFATHKGWCDTLNEHNLQVFACQ